jgi:group II intron reverse transcriptase/maturase
MSGKRRNIQYSLDLEPRGQGEALGSGSGGTRGETRARKPGFGGTTDGGGVRPGEPRKSVETRSTQQSWRGWHDDAKAYLREHWPGIRVQLLKGTYQPQPVKRVEIPKPDGGVRKLGVPCVVDRLIQQALLQVLQERPTFSEHSYGFRRSAHQAVAQAQRYVAEGYSYVVDLDLETFFDRVNHDKLMARVAARVSDKRVLKFIRACLKAGVMEDGLVCPVDEGTPQALSPLLSNLVLDDLDKELGATGSAVTRTTATSMFAAAAPGNGCR